MWRLKVNRSMANGDGNGDGDESPVSLTQPETQVSDFGFRISDFSTSRVEGCEARAGRVHRRCLASRHDVVLKPPAAEE